MFGLPDAKRVRRSDLYSPPSSSASSTPRSSPDPELTDLLRARLSQKLDIDLNASAATAPPQHTDNDGGAVSDEGEELEFRLFAPTAAAAPQQSTAKSAAASAAGAAGEKTQAAVQKIRIRSPTPDPNAEPGFVVPARPGSYYFADGWAQLPARVRAEYEKAAVGGADVLARAKATRWPGCAVPWKVATVSVSGRMVRKLEDAGRPKVEGGVDAEGAGTGRKRKSKRARIAIRKKADKGREKKEEAARLAREKEEAERAKRTARNREKKVKKKERDKAKKVAEGGQQAESDAGVDEGGDAGKVDVVMEDA